MALTATQKDILEEFILSFKTLKTYDLPYDLSSNKESVLEAVKRNGRNLYFASAELQADPELIAEAKKQKNGG